MSTPGPQWTPAAQRALEAAMRRWTVSEARSKRERWELIAADVPGFTCRQCVERARAVVAAIKANVPWLLRLAHDAQLLVLELLPGEALCALACCSRTLRSLAHDDSLWLRICRDSLPPACGYDKAGQSAGPSGAAEAPWAYCLRVRLALHGPWRKLLAHRAGRHPYLDDIGKVVRGRRPGCWQFEPNGGVLPFRVRFGAVAELVQLEASGEASRGGRPAAETYHAVGEFLNAHSPNKRSLLPPQHMLVREIYKACYPDHTAAKAMRAGVPCRGRAPEQMADEELRRRLEQTQTFFALVDP